MNYNTLNPNKTIYPPPPRCNAPVELVELLQSTTDALACVLISPVLLCSRGHTATHPNPPPQQPVTQRFNLQSIHPYTQPVTLASNPTPHPSNHPSSQPVRESASQTANQNRRPGYPASHSINKTSNTNPTNQSTSKLAIYTNIRSAV